MSQIRTVAFGLTLFLACAGATLAQTTDTTYQGKLIENSLPANASYDFEFRLYDSPSAGTQFSVRTRLAVPVTHGLFTVQLDFPSSLFDGTDRFLEIGVRTAGSVGGYQQLLPRQLITRAPYAIRSLSSTSADQAANATNAATAQNALQLGGVAANQYVLTADPRMTDARNPLPGSNIYIQNTGSPQASSNFNISGSGTIGGTLSANAVNATTQFNINGNRVLSNAGIFSLYAGVGAGQISVGDENSFFGESAGLANFSGDNNSFFGSRAGNANTNASGNSFFGSDAGLSNTTGNFNSFFGEEAGYENTTSDTNSFFGWRTGFSNTTGHNNSFFGSQAGLGSTTGSRNSFVGVYAGNVNTTGNGNSFFGHAAGLNNNPGFDNSFIGRNAGISNTIGSNNTAVGAVADVGSNNLTFATAIGAGAVVSNSNSVVLGRPADTVRLPGALNVTGSTILNGNLLSSGTAIFSNNVAISLLGSAGSTDVCRNASNFLSTCSSSLRYKTDIQPFTGGLNLVNRLRPISFNWKDGGMHDVGFGAEDVAKVEPLLVTYNSNGEIEGVKYGQLTTVLVNAIQQQQRQIAEQQTLITQQQHQLQALKKVVCLDHPKAELCKSR